MQGFRIEGYGLCGRGSRDSWIRALGFRGGGPGGYIIHAPFSGESLQCRESRVSHSRMA